MASSQAKHALPDSTTYRIPRISTGSVRDEQGASTIPSESHLHETSLNSPDSSFNPPDSRMNKAASKRHSRKRSRTSFNDNASSSPTYASYEHESDTEERDHDPASSSNATTVSSEAQPDLPPDWIRCLSTKTQPGREYYFSEKLKQSLWVEDTSPRALWKAYKSLHRK